MKRKWEERRIELVNNNELLERYKEHGKDFIEGYIQCLFNKHHINLKKAIKLMLYVDELFRRETEVIE